MAPVKNAGALEGTPAEEEAASTPSAAAETLRNAFSTWLGAASGDEGQETPNKQEPTAS
jgi:hypothetical protein